MASVVYLNFEYAPTLEKSLSENGTSLAELYNNLESLKSDVQEAFENFKTKFQTYSSEMESIKSSLGSVVSMIEAGEWQGDQANNFVMEYEKLTSNFDNAIKALSDNESAFQKLTSDFTEQIEPTNKSVEADSTYCTETSTWVANYTAALHEIEGN